jgi:hypothetical protein
MGSDSDLIPMVWADQSGRFGEGNPFSGVTIMQHPQNPGYPAGWCLRHYGFIGVSWPGEQVFAIDPNQQLYLRFRIWIHQGRVTPQVVEQVYSDYLEEDRDG